MISTDQEKAISLGPGAIEMMASERTAERRGDSYGVFFTGDRTAAVQTRPRQVQQRIKTPGKSGPPTKMPTAESRAAFRSHWKAAQEAADAMVRAAEADDRMSLAIAADDLEEGLAKLWDLRNGRDIDWQTILNHMQGMMRAFFQEKKAECLTVEQCKNIPRLVKDYLGPATKTINDLNEVLRLIDDAEFDPYAAISADPVDEEKE
jgi:hypothetical protein